MAGKADFTPEEWTTLQRGATGAGLLVSLAHRDFTDGFGEASAMAVADRRMREEMRVILDLRYGRLGSAAWMD